MRGHDVRSLSSLEEVAAHVTLCVCLSVWLWVCVWGSAKRRASVRCLGFVEVLLKHDPSLVPSAG